MDFSQCFEALPCLNELLIITQFKIKKDVIRYPVEAAIIWTGLTIPPYQCFNTNEYRVEFQLTDSFALDIMLYANNYNIRKRALRRTLFKR